MTKIAFVLFVILSLGCSSKQHQDPDYILTIINSDVELALNETASSEETIQHKDEAFNTLQEQLIKEMGGTPSSTIVQSKADQFELLKEQGAIAQTISIYDSKPFSSEDETITGLITKIDDKIYSITINKGLPSQTSPVTVELPFNKSGAAGGKDGCVLFKLEPAN